MLQRKKKFRVTEAGLSQSRDTIISRDDNLPASSACSTYYLGLLYLALASASGTLSSVFAKLLTSIGPGELVMIRCTGVWVGTLPIAIFCGEDFFTERKDSLMLVARGLLTSTGAYLSFSAVKYMPVAQAYLILSSYPVVITVLACLLLKEPCGAFQSLALLICLLGMLVSMVPTLARESAASTYLLGLACALSSVLFFSLGSVILRKTRNIHFAVSLTYFGIVGMVETAAIQFFSSGFAVPRCGRDRTLLLLIGLFGFLSQMAAVKAALLDQASVASVARCSMAVVFAMIFEALILNSTPDVFGGLGACLVVLSVSIIALRKLVGSLPDESRSKKRIKFLLY